MADEAGPSGTGTSGLSPEALQEAERKFERGIQCIRVGDRLRKGPYPRCEQATPLQFSALFSPIRRRCALRTRFADQRPGAGCAAVCRGAAGPDGALWRCEPFP